MAIVKDYVFDNLSRIGEDDCGMNQRNIQNLNSSNYMLQNFFSAECNMKRPIEFATAQPGINFTGSHQVGVGGCNIDTNSELFNGRIMTRPRSRISLFERPFKTVPFLGRGESNPLVESRLWQGDYNINKKSVNPSSEVCFVNHEMYPLIPSIASTISNPANLVEGVAVNGWIRGGVPSRELERETKYTYCSS
jgi:hypothetical protein